jgi:hypothetical protein
MPARRRLPVYGQANQPMHFRRKFRLPSSRRAKELSCMHEIVLEKRWPGNKTSYPPMTMTGLSSVFVFFINSAPLPSEARVLDAVK